MNTLNARSIHKLGLSLCLAAYIAAPSMATAAPGTLASVPLFTQANAEPNIMFVLDSSYSMTSTLGSSTRINVAKSALSDLVSSLSNVRIGYAYFDSDDGAYISETIDDIDNNRATILSEISSTTANDSTPLGEALRDIGRYFSNDSSGNCAGGPGTSADLTLHPGETNESDENCTDVLGTRITTAGPIQYSCQSNFVVYLTDGLARGDRGLYGTPLEDYDQDCTAAAQTAGGYTCVNNNNTLADTSDDTTPHYDMKSDQLYDTAKVETSDYFDDVAQALFEMDLRPDLNDDDGDPVVNNIRTYVIAFAESTISSSQLLQDAAEQGGGEFSYAADGADLASAFAAASESINNLIGSAAAVTFNTATLGTTSAVYLALFNSASWSGDLLAYDLNDSTGAIEGELWSAKDSLDALSDAGATTGRVILTYNGSQGVAFDWPADYQTPGTTELSTEQLQDLLANASYSFGTGNATEKAANDVFGQQVVDYLRGDTSNEMTLFRRRDSRLGDIVHAGPVYVGAPELHWPDYDSNGDFPDGTDAYSIYRYNTSDDAYPGKADRPGVVYIGSNDGFLHGFATENGDLGSAGDEVLAYAPKALFSSSNDKGYHYLTETDYNHEYYVDMIPAISDVYLNGEWRTVLVGGLRGGGRAYYALDVTDPELFSESNADDIVLGEFTSDDDADLGYTFSKPTIAMMENGRWAIITGNGYNSDNGDAALFIIYLDPDLSDGTWDEGDDYIKISTGIGDSSTKNGLSTPAAIDFDGNSKVDRVYAGDMYGNMWAFDLSATNDGSWDSAYKQGGNPKPFFTAGDGSGSGTSNTPITTKPEIVKNPEVDDANTNEPNVLVLFGTGQYAAQGDNGNLGDQSFYGVWDEGTGQLDSGDLVQQTISTVGDYRTVSDNVVDYNSDHGWYLPLTAIANSGERVVTDPVVRGDHVYFNTSIPSTQTCSYGGTGHLMVVQYGTGANPTEPVFDHDGNGVVDGTAYASITFSEGLPASPAFLGDRRYIPGTKTQSGSDVYNDTVEALQAAGTGQLSWMELTR